MDAIQFLTSQHHEVEALFSAYEELTPRARKSKADLVQKLSEALTIHSRIENDVFYPAYKRQAQEKSLVLEFLEEHHLVAIMLKQLACLEPSDETYDAKVKVLKGLVFQHVEEEQTRMFVTAKQVLDAEQLLKLGHTLQEQTDRFKGQEPHVTISMLRQVKLETPR
jgi:hypothetical protein